MINDSLILGTKQWATAHLFLISNGLLAYCVNFSLPMSLFLFIYFKIFSFVFNFNYNLLQSFAISSLVDPPTGVEVKLLFQHRLRFSFVGSPVQSLILFCCYFHDSNTNLWCSTDVLQITLHHFSVHLVDVHKCCFHSGQNTTTQATWQQSVMWLVNISLGRAWKQCFHDSLKRGAEKDNNTTAICFDPDPGKL